jgi:hypothetical protein
MCMFFSGIYLTHFFLIWMFCEEIALVLDFLVDSTTIIFTIWISTDSLHFSFDLSCNLNEAKCSIWISTVSHFHYLHH